VLHHGDVEPPSELAAHLSFEAHDLERARAVERDRRLVIADDPGDDGVEAVRPCRPEQRVEQQKGRALWWDKPQDDVSRERQRASTVPVKPYYYDTGH